MGQPLGMPQQHIQWSSSTAMPLKPCTPNRSGVLVISRRAASAGARVWGKPLGMPLERVEWSPDGQRLLFAGAAGGCRVYNALGDALARLALPCGQVPRISKSNNQMTSI